MEFLRALNWFVFWGMMAVLIAAIALILLRSLFKYTDKNPFTWSAITVKRLTDPVILPVRRVLVSMRLDPIAAPLIAIIIFILVGVFVIQIANGLFNTIAGILTALTSGKENAAVAILGYVLYSLIGLYELIIFARLISSWFVVNYSHRAVRFLFRSTEPLLAPLRRMIPPVSMFDISPIVAFLILWLLQQVVASTLLRGWPVRFF